MSQDTQTYIVQQDTPRIGRAGAAVQMTAAQAKYLVLAGTVLPEAEHKAREAAKAKAAQRTAKAPAKSGGK